MIKNLKGADFVKQTSSLEAVEKLQEELKSCLLDAPSDQLSSDQRLVCDRVLRACNQWAGDPSCQGQHLHSLAPLAEIACQGFRACSLQGTPFYLEKILFHLLKNVSARESSYEPCIQLSDLLYCLLMDCPSDQRAGGDYIAVARSSFQFLWKAAGDQEQKKDPCVCNQPILCLRLHALRFLMLVEMCPAHGDSPVSIARHVKFSSLAFESKSKSYSKDDACFLSQSLGDLLVKPLVEAMPLTRPWACCLVEVTLHRCRSICKRNCFQQSLDVIQQARSFLNGSEECCIAGLELLRLSVEVQDQGRSSGIGELLTEMTNVVGKVCSCGEGWLCQALMECSHFAVFCVDGHFRSLTSDSRALRFDEVFNLSGFLEAHHYLLDKQISEVPKDGSRQLRSLKQYQFSDFQQFTSAVCSYRQTCKDVNDELQKLVEACKGMVSRILTSFSDLVGQDAAEFLNLTASSMHNVAYWFYNQKKYQEASEIVFPLCEQLAMAGTEGDPDLLVERLHRCFRIHVESCRKAGQTEAGLAAVILWLRALRGQIQQHMAEPIALWVKLKIDGVKNGNEDLRLHTVKDGFGDHPVDSELMVSLLAEELRGYKSVHGDTGQERYNTICDLLELCAEGSRLENQRAIFLLDLAQVLCYHDYSGQTDCSALDAVQESLSLLNSGSDGSDLNGNLLDVKAQALLWQYICTLEANMRESLEEQHRRAKLERQGQCTGIEYEPNDLNYEDKLHDDRSVREGICFTLAGEAGPMKSLEEALNLWKSLLSGSKAPSLNNSEQTVFSLHLLGSLFRLMGKITLEEAESVLKNADSSTESYTLAELTCLLLRSHLFREINKVVDGVRLLVSVLQNPLLHKSSKACYILKVQALQELSMFLQLPQTILLPDLFKQLNIYGSHNPETALTEAHKLLRSIVLLLLGNDVLSSSKASSDMRFVDNGDNLLQKWQVLADLLSCSQDLVNTLSRMGNVSDAKSFCLEGLRLAKNLQSMRLCADFLVRKAELEILRAENQLCEDDLQYVVFLIESCTDFTAKTEKKMPKIKVSKGRKPQNYENVGLVSESPPKDDFLKGVSFQYVDTRDIVNPSASPMSSSLPEKILPCFVSHDKDCACSLCSDLVLSLLCTRWMIAQAENNPKSLGLLRVSLQRCRSITQRFSRALQTLFKENSSSAFGMADELVARVYSAMVLLNPPAKLPEETLEDGLCFLSSRPPNFPKYWKAILLLAKALNSIYKLATKHGSCIADVFMKVWGWQPPRDTKVSESNKKCKTSTPQVSNSRKMATERLTADLLHPAFSVLGSDSERLTLTTRPPTTPLRREHPSTQQKPVIPMHVRKGSVAIYNEESPVPDVLPRAPRRRQTRPVIKVVFSDSDLEMPDNDPFQSTKKTSAKSRVRGRTVGRSKAIQEPSESDEEDTSLKRKPRRGRPSTKKTQESKPSGLQRQRKQGKSEVAPNEIEMLRSIKEESDCFLDDSIEELRASDSEDKTIGVRRKGQKSSKKVVRTETQFEVLRRDAGVEQQSSPVDMKTLHADSNLFGITGLSSTMLDMFSISDLDSVSSLLCEALESIAHFPPSILYSRLCRLLALCKGGKDPYVTALLVSDSVSITLRHQLNSEIHRKLRKLKKESPGDISDQFQCLSLKDHNDPKFHHLSDLEELFRFSKQQLDTQHFQAQLERIPANTAVCILALADSQLRRPGDHLLLTRLERGSSPVTVQIPTAHLKVPISSVLREFDDIQKQQKIISNLTEKKEWWEGRIELDNRMNALIQLLEQILGCWKTLFMPPCPPVLSGESGKLSRTLSQCGVKDLDPALLKAVLGGSHLLTPQLVGTFTQSLCHLHSERAQEILQGAVDGLKSSTKDTEGHLVLVLDKHLQKLPWENISCLLNKSVTRLPSLNFLLSYGLLRKHQPPTTLVRGVDPKQTFYVLNPHANLPGTEERFRDWFKNEPGWKGVIKSAPNPEQLEHALTKQDLYIYVGHGAGAHLLDVQTLQRLDCNALVLLFGCSSAALAVRGDLEGAGIVLKYLMAGCPLVLGNLWDVTDREIDRYTVAFLQGWLKAGSGAPLLKYLSESRQAPKLRYIIGAAPVAYGLPVALR
uniref:separase n=1 Tax=Leptobrachium leishanense TaxID=445787 RepID=A0A8C5MBK5_9ANUR